MTARRRPYAITSTEHERFIPERYRNPDEKRFLLTDTEAELVRHVLKLVNDPRDPQHLIHDDGE